MSVLDLNEIAARSVMENTFSDAAKPEAKVALTRFSNAALSPDRSTYNRFQCSSCVPVIVAPVVVVVVVVVVVATTSCYLLQH